MLFLFFSCIDTKRHFAAKPSSIVSRNKFASFFKLGVINTIINTVESCEVERLQLYKVRGFYAAICFCYCKPNTLNDSIDNKGDYSKLATNYFTCKYRINNIIK